MQRYLVLAHLYWVEVMKFTLVFEAEGDDQAKKIVERASSGDQEAIDCMKLHGGDRAGIMNPHPKIKISLTDLLRMLKEAGLLETK
jgi:hypothetical protein